MISDAKKQHMINAAGGWNSPNFPIYAAYDQWVALGWVEWEAADPGQISWLVQGYYTVGRDMVKGY